MAPKPEPIILPSETNEEYYEMTRMIANYFEKFKIDCDDLYNVSCLCDRTIGFVNHIKNDVMKSVYENHGDEWTDADLNKIDRLLKQAKYEDENSCIEIVLSISKEIKRSKAGTLEAIQKRIVHWGRKATKYFKKPVEFIDRMKIINQNKRYLSRPRVYYVIGKEKRVSANKYIKPKS